MPAALSLPSDCCRTTCTETGGGGSGIPGPQGPAGPTGATGATGAQGIPGPTGATGATGAKGDKGDTGPPGTNLSGIGSPEGVQTSAVGGIYFDTSTNSLWYKQVGAGNTGWIQLLG